ncbi:MAG: hypothetical protein WAV23_02820 [Minisyncoccia bacterium]
MREVFYKSFKDTISEKFWNFIGGGAGSVIAILLIAKNFFDQKPQNSIVIGLGGVLGIYLFRFVLFFFKHIYKYWYYLYKESVYGDAIIFLKEAFSWVHWLRKLDEIPDDKFIATMAFMCHQLKLIYDKKTNSKCSVSIKVAIETVITANTEVVNLCRDKNSLHRDTKTYQNTQHLIFANTCFNNILSHLTKNKKSKLYYINNDIPSSKDYENTSKECYIDGILPYKSELVVPIIPLHIEQDKVYNLLGFLCVDCSEKSMFDEKYDLAILQGVADGIYDIICIRNSHKSKNK